MDEEALDERLEETLVLEAERGNVGQDHSLHLAIGVQQTQHGLDDDGVLGAGCRVEV